MRQQDRRRITCDLCGIHLQTYSDCRDAIYLTFSEDNVYVLCIKCRRVFSYTPDHELFKNLFSGGVLDLAERVLVDWILNVGISRKKHKPKQTKNGPILEYEWIDSDGQKCSTNRYIYKYYG